MTTTYIINAGAAIISRKIVERTGNIKWLIREAPIAPQDTGWRVLSDRDTDEYLADPANWTVVDFNDICDIEPACIGIYLLPVGSDIQLVVEPDGRRRWFDNKTEREIIFE
ncbi:MAG: DUF2185 domain-containing protein [Actinomyces graevenitzii]|jgi:hypothetical protein|uniref:DUF2185 domain-containing protein n=1 Tax=Actinomyces graevenitzii TaxID=55565 RepID=A0A9E7AMN7_9ACTO|nr:MAG: DUF2185 domain-containing protein [Actinomyces graevenitzii]